MEAQVYSLDGKKAGNIKLPENVFGLPWNADLVSQVVDSLLSSRRKNVAHTKNRGEVAGGGKKPWQQKGTGRARHGSIRSPIWRHGGVAHGPRNDKNYDRKVSKKMRAKALHTLLSRKWKDGEVVFVDQISFKGPKTKEALSALKSLSSVQGFENLSTRRKNAAAIALSSNNKNAVLAFRNLGNVEVVEARNLSLLTLLRYKYLVLENPDMALKALPTIKQSSKLTPHGKS